MEELSYIELQTEEIETWLYIIRIPIINNIINYLKGCTRSL